MQLSLIRDYERDAVTIEDVLRKMTTVKIKGKRCQCPLHNGHDLNMSFNDNSYYCFVCNEKGDIFTLVQALVGCDFLAAIRLINDTFGLSLPIGREATKVEKTVYKAKLNDIKEERERRERIARREEEHYNSLMDEYMRLDSNFYKYAPTSPDEPLDPRFVEACHKLEYQKYKMEQML